MSELIQALTIMNKYGNPKYPTHCQHDVLLVCISPELVSEEDKQAIEKLGFFAGEEDGMPCFKSYKFGSA